MKTEMHVVSSYEISPTCTVEGGFIRVGEKSSKSHRKTVYTMDEAINKLKRVLREMKNQDKDIYRQLMALNSNIKRLKNEIAGEEERRQQNDIDLEYECDSGDSDDDSCSDFEISDLEMNDIKCKEDSNQSSGVESAELKDPDSDSIHERFDSGIQEDASDNAALFSSTTPPLIKPKRPSTSWNGERSTLYNFLLTNLPPASDDSQESSDVDEENTSKLAPKVWDEFPEKQESTDSGLSKGTDVLPSENGNRIQTHDLPEDVFGDKQQEALEGGAPNGVKSKSEDLVEQGEGSKLERSQTPQPRTVAIVQGRRIIRPRRTMSEQHMKFDINANYIAKDASTKSTLGYISENGGKGTWNAFDARNYRGSERLIRRDILPIKSIRINQQMTMPESYDKQLNRSLTQLNIDGAISSSAIKAIQRSTSTSNCAVLTDSTIVNDNFSRSWNIPRKMAYELPAKDRAHIRLQKATGLVQQGDLEDGCVQKPNGHYSSTISLV